MISNKLALRIWRILAAACLIETVGLLVLAPYWNGGAVVAEVHGLAVFVCGVGVGFLLLSLTQSGFMLSTRFMRFMFAVAGGLAFDVIVTWGLWAIGYPITNGTVRRGLMAENYWLGPVILAYAVFSWLTYRTSLGKERGTSSAR